MKEDTRVREILLSELKKDTVGPYEVDETFEPTERPQSRYFSGVLFPIQTPVVEDDMQNPGVVVKSKGNDNGDEDGRIPINVGTKPSSMGLTCNLSLEQKSVIVDISYGRYLQTEVSKSKEETKSPPKEESESSTKVTSTGKSESKVDETIDLWHRHDYKKNIPLDLSKKGESIHLDSSNKILLRWFTRINESEKNQTLYIFLTNESTNPTNEFIDDSQCVFQPQIKLTSPDSSKIFLNISKPTEQKIKKASLETKETLFLFRNIKHFAIGRNCAVEWDLKENDEKTGYVQTTFVPYYYTPEIKPRTPTKEVEQALDMKYLSTITNCADYANIFEPLILEYEHWIDQLKEKKKQWMKEKSFENKFIIDGADVPQNRIDACEDALKRIREGQEKISSDPLIGEAFRFTNEVMYENRAHAIWSNKNKKKVEKGESITEDGPVLAKPPSWRLFQLAFVLVTIESIANPTSANRKTADLLWFPTGGGKTEAYYGIIAFTLAYRRLRGKDSTSFEEELDRYGVSIIMRYTYRLLTLQQFQRAVTLMCACEYVRLKSPENKKKFGIEPFLVGLWVGRATTPNEFGAAKKTILQKRSNPRLVQETSDPIQLLNCPWCGRKLDAFNYDFDQPTDELRPKRIRIHCDKKCFFGHPTNPDRVLPVVFVDEDIRHLRPSLLIATVDKFAQISWNWKYSSLFGNVSQLCLKHGYQPGNDPDPATSKNLDKCFHGEPKIGKDGKKRTIVKDVRRKLSPPELIIQDELHLIAGPLGTLTGLYETAIDILCTDKDGVKPKIIASTATTKKSDKQIQDLFDSDITKIFPPQGFDFGESYFAKVLDVTPENPGKLHVGICATGVGGYASETRIAACILRKVRHILENKNKFSFNGKTEKFVDTDLDPYYTLVGYYNTIKNLGAAVRMYEDTIPDYMGIIEKTTEAKFEKENNATKNNVDVLEKRELTGRVNAAEIPKILLDIETDIENESVLDALLCTNMLSVGVDVDRLGVMVINGQPKSTSEYIQSSGRIGRATQGIVVTNYAYIRPRDLSYFENFIQFHSTYHKSVEPGTLTPFSGRARDRGLSGVFIGLMRLLNKSLSKDPKNFKQTTKEIQDLTASIKKKISQRVSRIDNPELTATETDLNKIIEKWEELRTGYQNLAPEGTNPVLKYRRTQSDKRTPGTTYLISSSRDPFDENTFVIPESLREAESEISLYYSNRYSEDK
jgi:hypothetical protein